MARNTSTSSPYHSTSTGSSSFKPHIPDHSAAFPKDFTHKGYLDVRRKAGSQAPWKRRYFVLKNNFLLCAATPHARKLELVLPLEGSKIQSNDSPSTNDMTFDLYIRNRPFFFRAASPQQCTNWRNHIEKATKLKIKDVYRFLCTLGSADSQQSKVVQARHKVTDQPSAIKIVDKRQYDAKLLKTEIQILNKLDSPYIVKLYDIFETKKYLYVVMEFCKGGELFDQIADLDGDHYTEQDCCLVLHQIARGVKYMHEVGIVHRDLKPENILCMVPNSIKQVKIADFGISKMIKPRKAKNGKSGSKKNNTLGKPEVRAQMKTNCGTLSYQAPEVLRGRGYDYRVDFWSIGVIMFILLCGYPPFYGETEQEIAKSIRESELEFDEEDWTHVSAGTRAVCEGLLCKDPSKRLTCDNLLNLTFAVTSKSETYQKQWKRSRRKFKETVAERKIIRASVAGVASPSMDRETYKFGTRANEVQKTDRIRTAMQGRRKSKTTDQLEVQPAFARISVMEDFQTDDDIRKQKARKQEMEQNEYFKSQQADGDAYSDEEGYGDDYKEKN